MRVSGVVQEVHPVSEIRFCCSDAGDVFRWAVVVPVSSGMTRESTGDDDGQ